MVKMDGRDEKRVVGHEKSGQRFKAGVAVRTVQSIGRLKTSAGSRKWQQEVENAQQHSITGPVNQERSKTRRTRRQLFTCR
jgi:hypothetical protein